MKRGMSAGLAVVLGVSLWAMPTGAAERDAGNLQPRVLGTWTIKSGQRAGESLPEKHFEGNSVQFSEDTITVLDKGTQQLYAASYKLIPNPKGPTAIHMVSILPMKGMKVQGLIERKDDTIRLIYALPGGKAPSDFKAGEKQQMFLLKAKK